MWKELKSVTVDNRNKKQQVTGVTYSIDDSQRIIRFRIEPTYLAKAVEISEEELRGQHTISKFAWVRNYSAGPIVVVVEEDVNS